MSRKMALLLIVLLLAALPASNLPVVADVTTPSPAIQWVRQFGGTSSTPGNTVAYAAAANGDIYIGGTSSPFPGQNTGGAYIRKYDVEGDEVWTRQFGASAVFSIDMDSSGVYVVGNINGALPGQVSLGGVDAYIRKYDADGNEAWTQQFGSSSMDRASGIAVDSTGIYVVGEVWDTLPGQSNAGESDAYIRKYDVDGNEIWTHQFGSTGGDSANDVAIDNLGIYVLVVLGHALPGQTSAGAYIRKYDTNGNEVWTQQFSSFSYSSVAVNNSDVYVAGAIYGTLPGQISSGGWDVSIRKYDVAGNEIWARQFGSSSDDYVRNIVAASSGIYLIGETQGTLPGQTSIGNSDAYIRKYDVDGNEVWTRQFGSASSEFALGIAADSSGIYMAGYTGGTLPGQTSAGGINAFVRKYDVGGNEIWTRQFGAVIISSESTTAQALAVHGDIYIAGNTIGSFPGQTNSGSNDVYIRKQDMEGNEVWTRQFGSSSHDYAFGIAADSSGIYVAGYTEGVLPGQTSLGGADIYLQKYDSDGNAVWTRQFGSTSSDYANDIIVHSSGIYVVGTAGGALPDEASIGNSDAYIRKYDMDGNVIWTRQFGSSSADYAQGITADISGVYVVGYTEGTLPGQTNAGDKDAYIRKYDVDGNELWTRQFGAGLSEYAWGIAADSSGIYVVGNSSGSIPLQIRSGNDDVYIRKYDVDGNEVWTREFGIPSDTDRAHGITVNGSGVYVTVRTSGTPATYLRKYDVDGSEVWTKQLASAWWLSARDIAADSSSLYVVGYTGHVQSDPIWLENSAFVVKLTKDIVPGGTLYLPVINAH